jgi:hypothetical protein
MNNTYKKLCTLPKKYPSVSIVSLAILGVFTLAAVEVSGVLPLTGQTTPVYGPLPTKQVTTRKPSTPVKTRATSRSSVSTQTHAAASSVSSVTKWTGDECTQSVHPDATCTAKMKAVLTGDMSCFTDTKCYEKVWLCKLSANECAELTHRRWLFDAFFPGCTTKECIDGGSFLLSNKSASVKECLNSYVCRELLANFRRGTFACRQYEPCLNALGDIVQHTSCDSMKWCANMKKIDTAYTNGAKNCVGISPEACLTKLGVASHTSKENRYERCKHDVRCSDDLRATSELLGMGRSHSPSTEPDAGCFLLPECKDEFMGTKRWACETAKREPHCSRYTKVYKFLTETNSACVTSADTQTCIDGIKALHK